MTAFALLAYGVIQATFWFWFAGWLRAMSGSSTCTTGASEIRSSLDLHEVVTQLSRDATRLARGDYGIIALFDESSSDLVLRATFDAETGTIAHHQRPVDEWSLRRCAATNTTVVSTQQASAYRQLFGAELEERMTGKVRFSVCRSHSESAWSALSRYCARRAGPRLFATEILQVQQLSGQAVTAVEQAQLFAEGALRTPTKWSSATTPR